MQASAWYQGESLKRLLQGAGVGVVATLVIGFGWGGCIDFETDCRTPFQTLAGG